MNKCSCCFWNGNIVFSDEWENFMERINCKEDSEIFESDERILQLRHWVSLRGQTLCRTGVILVYYQKGAPSLLHC